MGNSVKCPSRHRTVEPTKLGSSQSTNLEGLEPTSFGRAELLNEKVLQGAEPMMDVQALAELGSIKQRVPAGYQQSLATDSGELRKFGGGELNEEDSQDSEELSRWKRMSPQEKVARLSAGATPPIKSWGSKMPTESTPSQDDSDGPSHFMATLEKAPDTRWCMDIDYNQKKHLKVLEVFEGPVMSYNESHPNEKIEDGDWLVAVNDKRGCPMQMAETLRDSDKIQVRVRKRNAADKDIRFTPSWHQDPMEILAKGKAEKGKAIEYLEALEQKSAEAEDIKADVIDSKPVLVKGIVRDLNIDKGFGFVRPETGGSGDAFFSFTGLLNCKTVEVGDAVTYIEDREMIEGQLCAVNVTKEDTKLEWDIA